MLVTKRVVGECRAGCGACCRHLYLPLPPHWGVQIIEDSDGRRLGVALPKGLPDETIEFYQARGLVVSPKRNWGFLPTVPDYSVAQNSGHAMLRLEYPCPRLTESGMCDVHGTARQPKVCREYPTPMTDLASVADVCTVRIEEVTEDG